MSVFRRDTREVRDAFNKWSVYNILPHPLKARARTHSRARARSDWQYDTHHFGFIFVVFQPIAYPATDAS
jgi:hypothetical protein